MGRAVFIARIDGLVVRTHLGGGDRFFDHLLVTNDRDVAARYLTPAVKRSLGTLEANWLLNAETLVYGYVPWTEAQANHESALKVLNEQLQHTRMLLKLLWLVRDNCANTDKGFLIAPRDEVSSSSLSLMFTMSDGASKGTTEFSREELHRARLFLTGSFHKDDLPDLKTKHEWLSDSSRFSRALYFIEAARVTNDLNVKIASYCTAFESMFASSEPGELTHKLGERLARFLGSDLPTRRDIYQSVKRAYEVRSRTLHGARASAQYEVLTSISRSCDDLLRRSMEKILTDDELRPLFSGGDNPRAISEYWLDLIFA